MVINTAGAEALRPGTRNPSDRCVALETIMALVKHQPALLVRHLPAVAEAIIKTLDPSEPEVRPSPSSDSSPPRGGALAVARWRRPSPRR